MDLKSKVLLGILSLSVVLSVASLFYKTVILQDFEVIDSGEEEGSLNEGEPIDEVATQDSTEDGEIFEESEPIINENGAESMETTEDLNI